MNMMNYILAEFLDCFVMVFLDDLLIYSRTPEDHAKHLWRVIQRLRDHKLYVKASKCEITHSTIEFLGQKVTARGLCPTEQKLEVVHSW